jgi:predicted N-acetyltransferase YhbS
MRWKLLGRQGSFPTVFVAALKDESALVGQYAGIPLNLKAESRILPSLCAVEAMTHPDHRRQGILTALVRAAHDTWARAGQEFVMGLPNEQWGARKQALGYREAFPLGWMRFPLRLDLTASRRANVPGAAGTAVAAPLRGASWLWRRMHKQRASAEISIVCATADSATDLDSIWSNVAQSWRHAVVRDADWVVWRYLSSERQPYTVLLAREGDRPIGYVAYRIAAGAGRRNGFIADLLTLPERQDVAGALVAAALDGLASLHASMVMTLAPPGSATHRTFRRLGFLPARPSASFSFELVPLQPAGRVEEMRDPSDWLLSGGDFDVV